MGAKPSYSFPPAMLPPLMDEERGDFVFRTTKAEPVVLLLDIFH